VDLVSLLCREALMLDRDGHEQQADERPATPALAMNSS
jgi:hypothetical protein